MICMIDFSKYLNCNDCRIIGLYCVKHRAEVEKKLFITTGISKIEDPHTNGSKNCSHP